MAKYRVKCPKCGEIANLSCSGPCPKCGTPITVDMPASISLYRLERVDPATMPKD